MTDVNSNTSNTVAQTVNDETRETVIPLFEESVAVSKRVVPTSRVQVSRITHSHEELVDELLAREQVEVERIPIDKPIDMMPSVREEGDIVIIPIVEEVLKVERQMLLKEEVRIRRVKTTERYQERVTLRRQEAVVNRLPIDETIAAQAETRAAQAAEEKK